jgi:hypothetical protein
MHKYSICLKHRSTFQVLITTVQQRNPASKRPGERSTRPHGRRSALPSWRNPHFAICAGHGRKLSTIRTKTGVTTTRTISRVFAHAATVFCMPLKTVGLVGSSAGNRLARPTMPPATWRAIQGQRKASERRHSSIPIASADRTTAQMVLAISRNESGGCRHLLLVSQWVTSNRRVFV